MAKARSRTAARKVKDKWKAKVWYNILAPPSFENVTIADTLADKPANLINRVTEVSLQDLTNDFRKSHIKLFFKIYEVEETNAHTTLTSDYLRRMIRRKRSKIDGVYDITTRDGAIVRVKPFATTDKRIQNSQRRIVRETMKKTIYNLAKTSTLSEFIKIVIDGKVGSDIYKNCKKLYPVKRVDVHKTQVLSPPTIEIEEEKPAEIVEQPEVKETEEKKATKKKEKKPVIIKKESSKEPEEEKQKESKTPVKIEKEIVEVEPVEQVEPKEKTPQEEELPPKESKTPVKIEKEIVEVEPVEQVEPKEKTPQEEEYSEESEGDKPEEPEKKDIKGKEKNKKNTKKTTTKKTQKTTE